MYVYLTACLGSPFFEGCFLACVRTIFFVCFHPYDKSVSFVLAHYKYVAFLYLMLSLFPSLLKCSHRNLAVWALLFCLELHHFLCLMWPPACLTFFCLNFHSCPLWFLVFNTVIYLNFFFLLKRLNNWCFRWSIPKHSAVGGTKIILPNDLY